MILYFSPHSFVPWSDFTLCQIELYFCLLYLDSREGNCLKYRKSEEKKKEFYIQKLWRIAHNYHFNDRPLMIIIIIIIINYFYNAHNTLQGMSLCAVRKKRLGGGTVQVHDIRDN